MTFFRLMKKKNLNNFRNKPKSKKLRYFNLTVLEHADYMPDMFSILMYADDTTLFCNYDNHCSEDVINAELNNVYSWLCSNRLSLNVEKTKYVSFHTAQKQ